MCVKGVTRAKAFTHAAIVNSFLEHQLEPAIVNLKQGGATKNDPEADAARTEGVTTD